MITKGKVFLLVAGVVVVGGFVMLSVSKRRQPTVEVRMEKVSRRDLVSIVTASGKVQPKRKVDVSSDITGRIVELPVKEGDEVQRGQVVVRIDPTQYQARVELAQAMLASAQAGAAQARANRDQAERSYVRARDLRAQNLQLVSQEALEQAQTQREIATANLEAARHQVEQSSANLREAQDALRKTTILAPMSGKITRLAVEEGEVAVPGTFSRETGLLMTISDLSVIEVKVQVDETDVIRLTVGDSTDVAIDAYPDTTFAGRVTEIANSSIAGAGTATSQAGGQQQAVDYEVVITLDRPPRDVRPDLSATAKIVTETRKGVLTVPIIALTVREPEADSAARRDSSAARRDTSRAALRAQQPAPAPAPAPAARDTAARKRGKEIEGVFVVDTVTKAVRFRPVKVGITGDEYFEVLTGVREGETIVSGSYQAIRDLKTGGHVRVSKAPAGADTSAARRSGS